MAQITVIYKDFEEMKAVARQILGFDAVPDEPAPETPTPVPLTPVPVPVAPTPVPVVPTTVPVTPAPAPVPTAPIMPEPAAPVAVPTTETQYTLDDLARAGMTVMDAGRQADLQKLLTDFGVEALPMLPKDKYGAFAVALRKMGAQI